jgi:PAS domain S-box-containing protein
MSTTVLAISIVVQVLAAGVALRLAVVTRFPAAWALISAGLILMGVRRSITFYRVISGDGTFTPDLTAEFVALGISALMLFGVLSIGPVLKNIDNANQEFRTRQADFRAYAEASSDYFWSTDANLRVTYLSEEFERITGTPARYILGRAREEIVQTGVSQDVWRAHLEDIEQRRPFRDLVFQHSRPDGAMVYLSLGGVPVFDERGEFQGYRGVGRDITTLTEVENERRQQATFLNSIVENIPAMVFVKQAEDLKFTLLNRAGEDMLGVQREDYIGQNDYDLFPRDQADDFTRMDRDTLAQEQPLDIKEERLTSLTRGERILRTKKIAIRDADGTPRYLLGISEDVTVQKAAEEKLALSLDEANRANQAKSEFLAKMSHDLRTPLNAIIGYSEMIAEEMAGPEVTPQYKRYAAHIRASGHSLLELVNDLLDLSRIEAARMELIEESFDLMEMVENCLAEFGSASEMGQGPTIIRDFDRSPLMVRADPVKLRQAVTNLLSNAVKFTDDDGTVRISLTKDKTGVTFRVADTGEGIDPIDLPHVFEPFHKGTANTRGNRQGVGLGLNIARSFVILHQGSVELESRLGEGTVATLWLPPERSAAA